MTIYAARLMPELLAEVVVYHGRLDYYWLPHTWYMTTYFFPRLSAGHCLAHFERPRAMYSKSSHLLMLAALLLKAATPSAQTATEFRVALSTSMSAFQSSTMNSDTVAAKAVDGNNMATSTSEQAETLCAMTTDSSQPWWYVDRVCLESCYSIWLINNLTVIWQWVVHAW